VGPVFEPVFDNPSFRYRREQILKVEVFALARLRNPSRRCYQTKMELRGAICEERRVAGDSDLRH
jgi:hypothetical protein